MAVVLTFIVVLAAAFAGYSLAAMRHHAFMARGWEHLSRAPIAQIEEMGVVQTAADIQEAFGHNW